MTLKHSPGGIISRSFSQWSLNSYAKFTNFVAPNNTWGSTAKSFLKEPTQLIQNPYVASEAQIKGVSLYTGLVRTTVVNFEAPVYIKPGDNPYTPGNSTNFSLTANATDKSGTVGSVSPRPSYAAPSSGLSLSAQVTDSRPGLTGSTAVMSPSTQSQSSAAVTSSFSPGNATVPTLVIESESDSTAPACIDAPFFPSGTITCPVGFQVVFNSGGDEAGCIPTDLWEAQQNNVISNLNPQTVLSPQTDSTGDRQWFETPPPDTLVIETVGNLSLCQGPYLPASGF